MPSTLSRIEREYVVLHLVEHLPPLSIQYGNSILSIPEKAYAATDSLILLNQPFIEGLERLAVRVSFRHKRCSMFFDSVGEKNAMGRFSIPISKSIFKDEMDKKGRCEFSARFTIGQKQIELFGDARFPLDNMHMDPDVYKAKQGNMEKLAEKMGFNSLESGNSIAVYRLYKFLNFFRESKKNIPPADLILYADNRIMLVSLASEHAIGNDRNKQISITLHYGNRLIACTTIIQKSIQLNNERQIACLLIQDIQEEDKRFLYERLFKEKYLG